MIVCTDNSAPTNSVARVFVAVRMFTHAIASNDREDAQTYGESRLTEELMELVFCLQSNLKSTKS
jgi:hypothetical protein